MPDFFSDEELLETEAENPVVGIEGISDNDLFLRGVANLIKRRLNEAQDMSGTVTVFVLSPLPPTSSPVAEFEPMFEDSDTPLGGRLWRVGPPVLSAHGLPLVTNSDAELFSDVIDRYGLGGSPAVVFKCSKKSDAIRFYPNGLSDVDNCAVFTVQRADVSLARVFAALDRIHKEVLVTPAGHAGGARLWQNQRKYYTSRNVELAVQSHVRTGLVGFFPTCRVVIEQSGIAGRLDVEIEERRNDVPGGFIRHVILELKVLRNFGSDGGSTSAADNRKWIDEGVEQASAYRIERDARAAALCCFDMRKVRPEADCFSHVRTTAAALQVALRGWRLFPEAKPYRAEMARGVSLAFS